MKWKWKLVSPVWLFVTPWDSPSQNTGVGSLSLLQGIFPTQGSNPGLAHRRWILYQLSHKGSPRMLEWVAYPSPLDLPDLGLQLSSPALHVDSLPTELSGKPIVSRFYIFVSILSIFYDSTFSSFLVYQLYFFFLTFVCGCPRLCNICLQLTQPLSNNTVPCHM